MFSSPILFGGEWSKVWIDVRWWGVHPFCFAYDKRKSNVWMREHEICSTDFPILLCEKKSEWATCIQSKKQCEHSCILAISLVAAYEMFEHIDMYICYYMFWYVYVMYIYNELLCFTFVYVAYVRAWLTHIRSPRKVWCKPFMFRIWIWRDPCMTISFMSACWYLFIV